MNGLGLRMKRLAGAAAAVAILAMGCDGSIQPISPKPADSAGGSGGTPPSMDASIDVANCRWEGYGIGSAGNSQCDAQHVLVHANAQCLGAGGKPDRMRIVSAECPADALEVEVYCCYEGGLPAASDTPIAMSSGPMLERLAPAPGEETSRAALLARAAASCLVGDWNALYASDGTFVEMLRFGCK
jgi:hypothetical protein